MGCGLIERTSDEKFISDFVLKSEVFDEISEDNFSRDEWQPDMNSGWFVHKEDDEVCGLWLAELRNGTTLEIHPIVPKKHRGKKAYKGAKEFFSWITKNTSYKKVNAEIATCYPNAKLFAMQCGMKVEGKIRASFQKNGKLHDQWMLGITREELEARYD